MRRERQEGQKINRSDDSSKLLLFIPHCSRMQMLFIPPKSRALSSHTNRAWLFNRGEWSRKKALIPVHWHHHHHLHARVQNSKNVFPYLAQCSAQCCQLKRNGVSCHHLLKASSPAVRWMTSPPPTAHVNQSREDDKAKTPQCQPFQSHWKSSHGMLFIAALEWLMGGWADVKMFM